MQLNEQQVKDFAAELSEPMITLKEQMHAVLVVMRKLNSIGIAPESQLMRELDDIDIKLDTAYRQLGHTVCQMVKDDDFLTNLYSKIADINEGKPRKELIEDENLKTQLEAEKNRSKALYTAVLDMAKKCTTARNKLYVIEYSKDFYKNMTNVVEAGEELVGAIEDADAAGELMTAEPEELKLDYTQVLGVTLGGDEIIVPSFRKRKVA